MLGAGPAGLAVVGTLLDCGISKILWVDPAFQAGRLSIYNEVPSKLSFISTLGNTVLYVPYYRHPVQTYKYQTERSEVAALHTPAPYYIEGIEIRNDISK